MNKFFIFIYFICTISICSQEVVYTFDNDFQYMADTVFVNSMDDNLIIFTYKKIIKYDLEDKSEMIIAQADEYFNTYDFNNGKILFGEYVDGIVIPTEIDLTTNSVVNLPINYYDKLIKEIRYVKGNNVLVKYWNSVKERDQFVIFDIEHGENKYFIDDTNQYSYQQYFFVNNEILFTKKQQNKWITYFENFHTRNKRDAFRAYRYFYIANKTYLIKHNVGFYKLVNDKEVSKKIYLNDLTILNTGYDITSEIYIYNYKNQIVKYNNVYDMIEDQKITK